MIKHIVIFVLSLIFLVGCAKEERQLQQIINSGKLKVLTTNSPLTYFEDRDGETAGYEYESINSFAKTLGVDVEYTVLDGPKEIMLALERGEGDIAAAGLSVTANRKEKYLFSDGYIRVYQNLLCHKGIRIKKKADLVGKKIVVANGSSFVDDLRVLKLDYPKLEWSTVDEVSHYQLFSNISRKEVDCTIIDSNILSLYRRYFPNLKTSITIGRRKWLAWMLGPHNKGLQLKINEWMSHKSNKENMKVLLDKYYGHATKFDPYDIKTFKKRIKNRLTPYIQAIKKAAKIYGWDWKLLAAISYQESHWDPKARSHTGVRGFMMLTRGTAKQMNVKNRLNPTQSIMGGAKYLKKLKKRLPSHIEGEDRTWMALASYNVGYAHLRDARGVAAWKDKNPNKWQSVREVLPLLSKRRIFKRLPHGYARGGEPVIYVDRIRNYYDLLKQYEKNNTL